MDFMREIASGVLITVIFPIILTVVRRKYFPEKKPSLPARKQRKALSISSRSHELMNRLRDRWGASRVYIMAMHNGARLGIAGLHFEKITAVQEACDNVTRTNVGVIKDYPAMQLTPLFVALSDKGRHHRSMHDEPSGSESQQIMSDTKVHDEFMVPLLNGRGVIVGIVGAAFHSSRADWSEDEWNRLEDLAREIESAMRYMSSETGGSSVMVWGSKS